MSQSFNIKKIIDLVCKKYFSEIVRHIDSPYFHLEGYFVDRLPSEDFQDTIMVHVYTPPWISEKEYDEYFRIYALDVLQQQNKRNLTILIGGIAHELGHFVLYRKSRLECSIPHDERLVDDIVIEKGLGEYLLEAKEYIRERRPDYTFNGYTPEEIREKLNVVQF